MLFNPLLSNRTFFVLVFFEIKGFTFIFAPVQLIHAIMKRGKQICKTLREVRCDIAKANDIPYEPTECRHQGDCMGTCPKCEQEVQYLERQLELRRSLGKVVSVVGVSMGLAALTSCNPLRILGLNNTAGEVMPPPVDSVRKIEVAGIPPAPPKKQNLKTDNEELDGYISKEEMDKPTLIEPLDSTEANYVFGDVVEQQPLFPGGNNALLQFIEDNLRNPDPEACVQGRVVVSFIIEKDGSVTNPKVERSLDPLFDQEALRVVGLMPKWMPAKYYGKGHRVKYTLPIHFKVK